jgi:putative ABC transport system substrate-binding protein
VTWYRSLYAPRTGGMTVTIGRRELLAALDGAAAAWPLAARAQQNERIRRIRVLMNLAADDPQGQARLAVFMQGLQEAGWSVGRNVQVDLRWGAGDFERYRKYAAELIALAPDVVLAAGVPVAQALQRISRTVPIVFANAGDPVGAGLVTSLARPGGNATGFTPFEYGMGAKWLELLKQVAPGVTRAAVLRDSGVASGIGLFGAIQAVAPSFGVELRPLDTSDPGEMERAISAFAGVTNGGLIVTQNTTTMLHRKLSSRRQRGTDCPRSMPSDSLSATAVCLLTGPIPWTVIGAPRATLIAFSRARSPPTCRYSSQPSTTLSSISRPRGRSVSTYPRRCSPAPTRAQSCPPALFARGP